MLANKTAYNIFLAKSQNENTKNVEEILKLGAWTTNVQAIAKMCVVSSATISVASTSMGASSSMEATATPVSAMNNAKILAIPPPLYPPLEVKWTPLPGTANENWMVDCGLALRSDVNNFHLESNVDKQNAVVIVDPNEKKVNAIAKYRERNYFDYSLSKELRIAKQGKKSKKSRAAKSLDKEALVETANLADELAYHDLNEEDGDGNEDNDGEKKKSTDSDDERKEDGSDEEEEEDEIGDEDYTTSYFDAGDDYGGDDDNMDYDDTYS